MAKMRQSTRTAAAKSTKRTSAKAAKPAQSAKSASGKTTAKKKATAARSTKARAGAAPKTTKKPATASGRSAKSRSGASTKTSSQSGRGAAKKANSRSSATTLDRWCKDCTDSLRKLVGGTPAKTGRRKRTSRAARRKEAQRWVGSTARQLGLGVRRGAELADPRKLFAGTGKKIRPIKFNSVTDFCKKELATLAGRLNKLANNPPHRRRKRTRK